MSNTTYDKHLIGIGCTAYIDGLNPGYGYIPHLSAGVIFCLLFGLSAIGHLVQIVLKRRTVSALLFIGAAVEVLGWAGRAWAAKCPYNNNAFMIQICCLIIAPVFFSAALYVLLGQYIYLLGRQSSIISARMYAIIFCTCDLFSLVLQGAGGGLASVESNQPGGNAKTGSNIMLAGIAFQLATMTIYGGLFADFLRRTHKDNRMTRGMRLVLGAMSFAFVMIYIRSIYRTIELSQGWNGYVITHEAFFCVLDALTMFLAVAVFNVADPARLLPKIGTKLDQAGYVGDRRKDEGFNQFDNELSDRS